MKLLAAVVGQSNEVGSVTGLPERVGGIGAPLVDPIAPNGSSGSWWPRLSALMARRGHWLDVHNSARGSTCLTDVWVGRCRSYQVGMVVQAGSYVLDGGNVYKAVGAASTVFTLNVAPSAGVGTSGLTIWTNLGAATARDIDGQIYTESDAGRFDPNGYLEAIVTATQPRHGYDQKLVIFSIGQGDKTVSSTRAQYGAAMQSSANYFTSRGYTVFLGFTCYGATAGLDAWYSSDLMPGRADALAALAGNSLVKTGADLRTALGALAVSPSYGPGLQSDQLHLNYDANSLAADAWNSALDASGF